MRHRDGLQFKGFCANIVNMLATKKKQTIIKKNQIHDKDTGSPEVQVAVLSTQIDLLAKHLKKHKKDNHLHLAEYKWGKYGFVLKEADKYYVPVPCKGALNFWDFD